MTRSPLFTRLINYLDRFPRSATRWGWRFTLAVITGVVAGFAAVAMESLIEFGSEHLAFRVARPAGGDVLQFDWRVLLLPAAGGLVAGVLVYLLCRNVKSQGVELLTRAFHHEMGALDAKAPLVKAGGSIVVISSGGSAGPEAPIAALGAAIGSTIGRWFPVTPHERRIMLVAGCAAGVGAVFRCPLGGALFAAGILYQEPEYETDAMVPAVVASVIAYTTFMIVGPFVHAWLHLQPVAAPMLKLPGFNELQFFSFLKLLPYVVLGPLCALVSILLCLSMRVVEHRIVPRSPLPRWLNPAIGGLLVGAIACALPQVMDGQYLFIRNAMMPGEIFYQTASDPWRWTMLFALITVAKCIASALTVGSGAPGGLLGPSVFIGGTVGAFLGALCEAISPNILPPELRAALIPVGMAGVLACTMRVPLAALVMVTEMTGSYGLIAPLMLVCVSSYILGRRWGLNHEQVPTSADSPAHAADPIVHVLESLKVGQIMQRRWPLTVAPDAPLDAVVERIEAGTRPVIAVARDTELLGLIEPIDLGRVLDEPGVASMLVASDVMSQRLVSLKPTDDVYYALSVFHRTGYEVLPVFERGDRKQWLGMLSRYHIASRLQRHMSDLQGKILREHEGLGAIGQDLQLLHMLQPMSPSSAHRVHRLFVPIQVVGQSLRHCNFRKSFSAHVIAIEQRDGAVQCPPDLDAPLRTDQRLWVIREDQKDEKEAKGN